jgi:hypothetical protein
MQLYNRNVPSILNTDVGILKGGRQIEQVKEVMKANQSIVTVAVCVIGAA